MKRVVTTQTTNQEISKSPNQTTIQKSAKVETKNNSTKRNEEDHQLQSGKVQLQSAKRAGSPIHNHDNTDNKLEVGNEEEEEKARRCVIA